MDPEPMHEIASDIKQLKDQINHLVDISDKLNTISLFLGTSEDIDRRFCETRYESMKYTMSVMMADIRRIDKKIERMERWRAFHLLSIASIIAIIILL